MQDESKTKFCRGCESTKATSDFYKDAEKPDGLQSRCKVCVNKRCRRRYQSFSPEKRTVVNKRKSRLPKKPEEMKYRGYVRHSLRHTRLYQTWMNMWQRCTNPKMPNYKYYGGRGITVCSRWESVEAFLEDMGHPPDGLSLDRIDVNGNYEPSNCRWADNVTQANNKRTSKGAK